MDTVPIAATRSISILRDPLFGRLWFIQAANQVGGNMALYALTVLVFSSTRSNAAVSALVTTFVLPPIILSPLAGVIVDRLDLRWALVVPNVVRCVLTAGLAIAGADLPVLLALNLGVSLTSVALTPAEGAMIPRVVPRDQLESAMGIFNLTLQASFAVGFAFLGPVLVSVADPSFVLGVVTVFYIAATLACIGLPSAPPARRATKGAGSALREPVVQLVEGFRAVAHNRELSRPLLHLASATSVVGVLGVLGPGLAASIGLDPKNLIVVVLPLGLGVVGGVLGLRRWGRSLSRRRAAEAALVALGVLTAAIALAAPLRAVVGDLPTVGLVVVMAFLAGAAYAVTSVSTQTAMFENMALEVRGRVFGILASVVSAASLVPTVLAGPLADVVSASSVAAAFGVLVLVIGILSARFLDPTGASPAVATRPDASDAT